MVNTLAVNRTVGLLAIVRGGKGYERTVVYFDDNYVFGNLGFNAKEFINDCIKYSLCLLHDPLRK